MISENGVKMEVRWRLRLALATPSAGLKKPPFASKKLHCMGLFFENSNLPRIRCAEPGATPAAAPIPPDHPPVMPDQ